MAFLWDAPPRVIGHRGSPREAPENTLASFLAAVRAGAGGVELDARLTKDHAVIVHHDAELGRTSAGSGLVEQMDFEELARVDAGAWFAPEFKGESIPTLAQVLERLPRDFPVNVELKADGAHAARLPALVLDVVRRADALDRVLVTSFDPALADEYARLSGRPAGSILPFVPDEPDVLPWPRLRHLAIAQDAAMEDVTFEVARRHARSVLVWTVNDPETGARLLARGAAGIITDRPGPLARRLEGAPGAAGPEGSAP